MKNFWAMCMGISIFTGTCTVGMERPDKPVRLTEKTKSASMPIVRNGQQDKTRIYFDRYGKYIKSAFESLKTEVKAALDDENASQETVANTLLAVYANQQDRYVIVCQELEEHTYKLDKALKYALRLQELVLQQPGKLPVKSVQKLVDQATAHKDRAMTVLHVLKEKYHYSHQRNAFETERLVGEFTQLSRNTERIAVALEKMAADNFAAYKSPFEQLAALYNRKTND